MRVLSWNLKHGRAVPSARRELFEEFAGALAGWRWEAALLQEVPPWWPAPLAARLGAEARLVLTSRNALLPVRRALARRWPDLIKSNGGGANAILFRGAIAAHRARRLCWAPERRWVHAVRVDEPGGSHDQGLWLGNLHIEGRLKQAQAAAAAVRGFAGGAPVILGGDFNLRGRFELPGLQQVAVSEVDHVFLSAGLRGDEVEILDAGPLSDHRPVAVTVSPAVA